MKRVLLITGPGSDAQGWGDMKVTDHMRDALVQAGIAAEVAYVETWPEFIRAIEHSTYDIAWSSLYFLSRETQVIGIGGDDTQWVADELDARGIPYIGPNAQAMKNLIQKHATHRILAQNGVPAPANHLVTSLDAIPELAFPAFVKPDCESRSLGISDASVVMSRAELEARVAFVLDTFRQPALVEEYLPGAEYTVLMLGNGPHQELLPGIVNVDAFHYGKYHILRSDLRGVGLTRLSIPDTRAEEARELARRAGEVLGCRDHVRVDMRVDAGGRLRIIEVNGIPGLKPVKSWSPQLYSLYHPSPRGPEMEYREMLRLIVQSALAGSAQKFKLNAD